MSTFQRAAEQARKMEATDGSSSVSASASSGVGAQMHIARAFQQGMDEETTGPDSNQETPNNCLGEPIVLPRDVYNETARMHNQEAREIGHPSQIVSTVHGGSSVDEEGNLVYKQPRVYTILSDTQRSIGRQRSISVHSQESSRLWSPPPTTNYGGSEVSIPSQTPRARVQSPLPTTNYEGSLLGLPPSALPEDPFSIPRARAGISAQRYILSEENTCQHATGEEGMEGTRKVYTPIPRKSDVSDSSEDAMTEVEWRDETPYMTPTKKGKKRNKGKGVSRPKTAERPIRNMPQTPSRRKLEADLAKPAGEVTNGNKEVDLEAFIGEYLKNTNGMRDFMINKVKYDDSYSEWCGEQAGHIAVRHNHTDAAVASTRKIA